MDVKAEKEILRHSITTINDPETTSKLKEIKKEEVFDFEKEWKEGIKVEEAREKLLIL